MSTPQRPSLKGAGLRRPRRQRETPPPATRVVPKHVPMNTHVPGSIALPLLYGCKPR
jgi:hypothetical protein